MTAINPLKEAMNHCSGNTVNDGVSGDRSTFRKRTSRQTRPTNVSRVEEGSGDRDIMPPQRSMSREQLAALPFVDFALTMANLLTRMGYEDVRVTGRARGTVRDGTGGYDLRCSVPDGVSWSARRTVIVLLKQFGANAWVFQRMVDELRGVAIREGADEAILITTGRLSPVIARCEEGKGDGVAHTSRTSPPVQRMDGERLCRLLTMYGVTLPSASSAGKPAPPLPAARRLLERVTEPNRRFTSPPKATPGSTDPERSLSSSGIVVEVRVRVSL